MKQFQDWSTTAGLSRSPPAGLKALAGESDAYVQRTCVRIVDHLDEAHAVFRAPRLAPCVLHRAREDPACWKCEAVAVSCGGGGTRWSNSASYAFSVKHVRVVSIEPLPSY